MLTSRNRRSNLSLKKTNELKKNDRCSKFKLGEKENQLIITIQTENKNVNDGDIVRSLRSSALKNVTSKGVRNAVNKKNNSCKKNVYEILDKSPENENMHKGSCRRKAVKQSSLLKNKTILNENDFNIKNNELVNSFVKKQRRNIKHVDLKECNKSVNKLKSHKISMSYHCEKYGSRRINKRKCSEMETNIKHVSNIPIWKRQLNLNNSNNLKKKNTPVDVYDIALDEELMASEVRVQKNKICKPKKVKTKKDLILLTKKQNHKNKHTGCDNFDPIDKETNKFTSKEINEYLPLVPNNINNSCLHDGNEILKPSAFGLQSTDSKLKSNKLLLDFADELEKSFLIPKMTSTPDTVHGVQVQKTNISNIATNKNCLNITVETPCDPVSNDLKKAKGKEGIGDITLFESPTKKKNKIKSIICKSPTKLIQINLFGEVANSPSNEQNLNDSVLMPKKAYHTPDNFKIHLARTKRTEVCKKETKKSKDDMLIEKMTQHFDEVDSTKLCIE